MSTPLQGIGPDTPARAARNRQIFYAITLVVLFTGMHFYRPYLQERKEQADLGEAALGQIDAAGFAVKLSMVAGLRGIVVNWLWSQSMELQKEHEWDQLMTYVNLITKLQPHFLSVWTFQGWNLAYNVSVEWDAPEDKYIWIKKGINFLRDGVAHNTNSADLIWDTAWTYYHKLGFADEAIILRGLFYRDPDDEGQNFKVDPITGEVRNDNFQVAKGWFLKAVDNVESEVATRTKGDVTYVDKQPQRKGRPDDLSFFSMPAHAQTRFASAREKASIEDVEPQFGQFAQIEWQKALADWTAFGRHRWTTFNYSDQFVYLDDITDPAKYQTLGANQQYWTERWADQMNYRYWKTRSQAESEEQGVSSRRLFYEGTVALRQARFSDAIEKYRQGLSLWGELLERYPTYRDDLLNQRDTGMVVKRYVQALTNAGETIPDDLPFKDLYEAVRQDSYLDPFDQLDMMRASRTRRAPDTGNP